MRVAIHGTISAHAVAVIGAWDPLLPFHEELLEGIAAGAHASGRSAVAVMLDPDPLSLLYGPARVPGYDHWSVRIDRIRACGIDAVARVHFRRAALNLGAADLLEPVAPRIGLVELWLGEKQNLGRGSRGGDEAITGTGARLGFEVRRLPGSPSRKEANELRGCLAVGEIRRAMAIVGRPPVWPRPRSGVIALPWRAGAYRALPLGGADGSQMPVTVTLHDGRDGLSSGRWPARAGARLAFIAGPGDSGAILTSRRHEVAMAG